MAFDEKFADFKPPHAERSITIEIIDKSINKLKGSKAAGIDGIEPEHLKFAHPVLHLKLCTLFNMMIARGKVPELFGSSLIIPVPKDKSGDLCSSKNYRV